MPDVFTGHRAAPDYHGTHMLDHVHHVRPTSPFGAVAPADDALIGLNRTKVHRR